MKSKESKISKETSLKMHSILDSITISEMVVPARTMKIYKRREKRFMQMVKRLLIVTR